MSLPVRHIRRAEELQINSDNKSGDGPPKADPRARAEIDSHMVMVRYFVGEADEATADYLFRSLLEQCRFLSRKFGYNVK